MISLENNKKTNNATHLQTPANRFQYRVFSLKAFSDDLVNVLSGLLFPREKNGHFYCLLRRSGKFIIARNFIYCGMKIRTGERSQ